jgi:hypothetical protein
MTEAELLDEAEFDPNHERRLARAREIADHARKVWDSMTPAEHDAVLASMYRNASRRAA